jgi:aryl-phospho-beta-D-glucosidase BglC (GH1 family)
MPKRGFVSANFGERIALLAFTVSYVSNRGKSMLGINLSGAEFGRGNVYGRDYIYPGLADLQLYAEQGVPLVRLPFKWERMQPTLNAPLDPNELGRLTTFLAQAADAGVKVIVDLHNYGRYRGHVVNSAEVPDTAFVDFWTRLSGAIKDAPALLGYDLMNEPHDMHIGSWPHTMQLAVNAIRSWDMRHNIYAEGTGWSSTWNWPDNNGKLDISDPADKLYYEAHIYFDADNSGTYRNSYDTDGIYPEFGVDRLTPFADWLKQTGNKGFIGEYGAPEDEPRWLEVMDNFLKAAEAQGLDTAYFGAGPWSSSYRAAMIGPDNVANPQMGVFLNNRTNEGFAVEGTDKADVLTGSVADDRLTGSFGNDIITAHAGRDSIDGGPGSDTMRGGLGSDIYSVDNVRDRVVELPGEGNDEVHATLSYTLPDNVEKLVLRGGAIIDGTGNALNNSLQGNDAANRLNGGSGDDLLIGRGGSDMLIGGAGKDVFDFNTATDSRPTNPDHIADFQLGSDRIDLSTIDADPATAGNQAFVFIGETPFHGLAGELRLLYSDVQTTVQADWSGDAEADMMIILDRPVTLAATDFLL